ncbi:MAG: hypothetical protein A2087_04180 [Spirochaetes bacterium GWD1_61_31]|nr:MAG: hypothetical protein A2Y37_10745 [Spirochaetes bacterium GWB1_60_80]OHD34102.1 MAG: hypothetical protein A2004_05170 [Spirochaetes bacterium GWC1_61_12]OHD35408.1 MAG: hypothetical protein A2087_04180 [Spirochaetes bacterium GWD1_61_31]OHD60027.1 MAG: hypothetical protein A2Y32_10895 [Spirochaetes bacterium GWF1_60_12]
MPISLLKRVPILINLNYLLIAYFMFASFTRYLTDPTNVKLFFIAVNVTNGAFLISQILVRLRRYLAASTLSTLGILCDSLWIGVLLPSAGSADLYRLAVYVIASCVVNSMLAIRKRQIIIYGFLGYAVLLLSTLLVYAPRSGGFNGEIRTVFITMTMLYIPTMVVLLFTNKLASDVIQIAETEVDKNRHKAEALNQLIKNAKNSLQIGKTLLECADDSKTRGDAINTAIGFIKDAARDMSGESSCADTANKEVVTFADEMQTAVHDQNAFLEENSTAVTEIMTTIQNIAHLADQKRTVMDGLLGKLQEQEHGIHLVIESFERIRASSGEVLSVVSGIFDVSEKTNMLAMNASIEAAHAGSSGKGFAVIAGEIRKLSQETQTNTEAIGRALSRNDDIVTQATVIVHQYTDKTAGIIKDVQDTFNAMEEIISGLGEISLGTKELTAATGNMITIAHDTGERVVDVARKVKAGSESVARINEFACQLDKMIGELSVDFKVIEGALGQVKRIGEQNIEKIMTLEQEMDRISAS